MKSSRSAPELLAPAGDWECARAAVANGADAIYFGLPEFNARMRAHNFTAEDLPELMRYLHDHGVRGFVTMNTLIFTDELEDAEAQLRLLDESGVDAAIIQDMGLARLAKRVAPNVELHASTQMTITSPEGLALVDDTIGLDLAVLARETSIKEMERFDDSVPLEVFVHGALCVAYSGQCLTSESLGQRSANRGECAQACRMEYELIVDGEKRDLGDKRYLLSPQDLVAIDEVPALIEAGISSFKIEGRLKTPEYVAAVTKAYRKAIDATLDKGDGATAGDRYAMEMTFSRGLSSGWMHGVDHGGLVKARFGKKRGAFVGRLKAVGKDYAELVPSIPIKAGDGVVFDTGDDTEKEQGGSVYEVRLVEDDAVRLYFKHGHIRFGDVGEGARVWKTADPALDKKLRSSWKGRVESRTGDVLNLKISGREGQPLRLEVLERAVVIDSGVCLALAEKRPLAEEVLRKQLGRLGETRFELGELTIDVEGDVILPVSELNRMRRAMVAQLEGAEVERAPATGDLKSLMAEVDWPAAAAGDETDLTVLCRTPEQIGAALEAEVPWIVADYEDIARSKDAVEQVRAHNGASKIMLAMPRIQKPGEAGFFKVIERAEPDGVLLRNLGGVAYFRERDDLVKFGDFSLNVANPLSADYFLSLGLDRITISYDLAIAQVLDVLLGVPDASRFELTLHQHMPMFHMEHCVFCTFMSEGTSVKDCGRPCDTHEVQLRDRVGMLHPLKADVGCRNTLFNGKAQTGAKFYNALHGAGARHFRVELLDESASEAGQVIEAYQGLIGGERGGTELWHSLRASSKLGVTVGTLEG